MNIPAATTTRGAITVAAAAFAEVVERVSSGDADAEVLRRKRTDVLTARVRVGGGGCASASVIVKLWDNRGARAAIRRLTGTDGPCREWRALNVLRSAGASVPAPLYYGRLYGPRRRHTHAVVTEDLGPCARCSERLTSLFEADNDGEAAELIASVIDTTAAMVECGVLDIDHSLMNFIVPASAVPRRVDLEYARRVGHGRATSHPRLLGAMLGRLVTSYVFSVQPCGERVEGFCRRLESRVVASPRVLRAARDYVDRTIGACRARGEAIASFRLPW